MPKSFLCRAWDEQQSRNKDDPTSVRVARAQDAVGFGGGRGEGSGLRVWSSGFRVSKPLPAAQCCAFSVPSRLRKKAAASQNPKS